MNCERCFADDQSLPYPQSMRFIVLSSSNGTTFQATIDRMKDGSLTAQCAGLITDSNERKCIEKAAPAGIPVEVVEKLPNESREAYDKRIQAAMQKLLQSTEPSRFPLPASRPVIACMGWLWILSPWFIRQWKGRVLNVHPALLPKFGGKGMFGHHVHDAVLKAKERESGMTIHLMDEGVDTGKILLQRACPVLPDDTVDTLRTRVVNLEKEWYPKVLQMIEEGEIVLS
jgi:phosphoribosylglycinamide formyltransferase-1